METVILKTLIFKNFISALPGNLTHHAFSELHADTMRNAPKFHDLNHDTLKVIYFGSLRNIDEMNHEKAHQRTKLEAQRDNSKRPIEQTLLKRVCKCEQYCTSSDYQFYRKTDQQFYDSVILKWSDYISGTHHHCLITPYKEWVLLVHQRQRTTLCPDMK